MKAKARSIFFELPVSAILFACLVLPATSCSQDQLQAPVSQNLNNGKPQNISEGLTGKVTTRNGQVVIGAMIIPTPLTMATPPIPDIAITTDTNGRYEWPLKPGPYQITAFSDGFRKHTRNIEIKANQVSTLDFFLDKLP